MDAKEAIGILRGDISPASVLHRGIAEKMGAEALELLAAFDAAYPSTMTAFREMRDVGVREKNNDH